jgi:hypothetical protein
VHPPNPLFGRFWSDLNDYVKRRNASEVIVEESTEDGGGGLNTKLLQHVNGILENPNYTPSQPPDITDAAMLMAADGYGSGKIKGEEDGVEVIIRTSDTQKSFAFSVEPNPEGLAEEAKKHFEKLNSERSMKHK